MYSKATQTLFDEHEVILKAIEQAKAILQQDDLSVHKDELLWYVRFFKEYGDEYHHQKEEEILFKFIEESNEMLGGGLISSLTDHHNEFRDALRNAQDALKNAQWDNVRKILNSYFSDMRDHIGAENDELFISTDSLLNDQEKDTIYYRYMDKDRELGEDRKSEFENKIKEN